MNPQNLRRKRGVILTPEGLNKLQTVKRHAEEQENFGSKYTFEELSKRSQLAAFTIAKILAHSEGVDKQTLECFFRAFGLALEQSDYCRPKPNFELEQQGMNPRSYWEEIVDVSVFYGRTEELNTLEHWILKDRCRLVAILGMGGIGKTTLSVKLAEQIQHSFEVVIWQSLRNGPPVKEILTNLLQFLSHEQKIDLTENVGEQASQLMDCLRSKRCLLVLDNLETILTSSNCAGHYREGYEGYSELLRRVGEERHQSCLVLTSREKPKRFGAIEGKTLPVRSLQLTGLNEAEGQAILKTKGLFGAENSSTVLVNCYSGNPLALKIVATTIKDLFDGNVTEFLTQSTVIFGDIRELLEQQFERLSALEKEIMYWLAVNREPVSLSQLRKNIVSSITHQKLLEALESLKRRCLIEHSTARFTLQTVVMEYVTAQLVE